MTAKTMAEAIGQRVRVQIGSMLVDCYISDVKTAYGIVRYQVGPVSGEGSTWIEASSLR